MAVGTAEMLDAFRALGEVGWTSRDDFREALAATDLRPSQLMMGFEGVKFDEKGQNVLATTLLIQLKGDEYVAVWPDDKAVAPLELPFQGRK